MKMKSGNERKKIIRELLNRTDQEFTDEEVGSWINLEISKKLEINKLYFDVKNQFDVLYKNMKVERNSKITLVLMAILVVTLIFNVLNYFKLLG